MCVVNIVSKQFYEASKTREKFFHSIGRATTLDSTQNRAAYKSSDFM